MRRFFKSRTERMFFGVAGGLGQALDIDPVILRVAFVLSFFMGGVGILAYFILAIVMPTEPYARAQWQPDVNSPNDYYTTFNAQDVQQRQDTRRKNVSVILGSVLVLCGAVSFFEVYLPDFDTSFIWPLLMVGGGIALLLRAFAPAAEQQQGPTPSNPEQSL